MVWRKAVTNKEIVMIKGLKVEEDGAIELMPLAKTTAVVIVEPDNKHKKDTDVVVAVAQTEFKGIVL